MSEKQLVLLMIFFSLFFMAAIPGRFENQPIDSVLIFNKCYGSNCMAEIPKISTSHFLKDMPAAAWVLNVLMLLFQKNYKRSAFELISTKMNGDLAEVVAQVKISTRDSEKWQTEVYLLIKRNGIWLIDEVIILDMNIDGF